MITHIFDCFPDAVDFKWCKQNADNVLIVLCLAQAINIFFQFLNFFTLLSLIKGVHPFKQIIVKTLVNTSANFHDVQRNVNVSIMTCCSMIHVLTVPLAGMPNCNGISSPFLTAQNVCLKSGVLA